MARPLITFRVDASLTIGSGHVMRCLTLADALVQRGAQCHFVCRSHVGHMLDAIRLRGHTATALDASETKSAESEASPRHAHWLGASWQSDATETLAAIGDQHAQWLVVDHYALDERWERAVRESSAQLMVIDDLADRPHDCDLLLDQNLGRTIDSYADLTPPTAHIFAGAAHALLRPEFAELRNASLARRAAPRLDHLLVTMGGVDKDNATQRVLDALARCALPSYSRITVVMGAMSPWTDQVRARASAMPCSIQVLVGTSQMAQLMVDSDLAIGAAGSTSWERCCLGLPTIQLVLADNQAAIAQALADEGAAWSANDHTLQDVLEKIFSEDFAIDRLASMSRAAAAVTDGLGAPNIAKRLAEVF